MHSNIPVPVLTGSQFILRPFKAGDEASLQASLNDERVARKVSHIPFPYTLAHARDWVASMQSTVLPGCNRVDFVIDIDGAVAGSVAFIHLDDHKGQVSYWLTPAYWGKGIVTEALGLLVEFGQKSLGLVRIYAYVYAENKASARVLQKTGFVFEGTHRKEWHKHIDGEEHFFDSKYYALVI